MTQPQVTVADWRAQVEKELAGAAFEKALVHTTAEGLAIQPLYTEATTDSGSPGAAPFTRGSSASAAPFRLCMRHRGADTGGAFDALGDDLAGGVEALWIQASHASELESVLGRADVSATFLVIDGVQAGAGLAPQAALTAIVESAARRGAPATALRFALGADPIGGLARGRVSSDGLADELAALGLVARRVDESCPRASAALVSTLPYHGAGADAAEELAIALSTGAAYLGVLLDAGLDVRAAARQIAVQIAVGRDTFMELCKLRALRHCWHKLLAAAGAPDAPLALLHAVCSSRTLTERDPWVNMLRVTTQVFGAVLGGAELVTPAAFDAALGPPSELGRRIARNTALVLREESHLGRVTDPAGGSYYLESLTDGLAREAWRRFRSLEKEGGVVKALTTGALHARLEAAWNKRREAITRRKEPITGVSEYANLDEAQLPRTAVTEAVQAPALASHRDAEPFEQLRTRADALAAKGEALEVVLLAVGPPAEHRARAGFASAYFAAAGLRAREVTDPAVAAQAAIVCLCGTDERYATEAVARAQELKSAGCRRVLLAGRPGALEPSLRAAGVDGFVFVGSDLVATLAPLVGGVA